jgi:hypothetical protein
LAACAVLIDAGVGYSQPSCQSDCLTTPDLVGCLGAASSVNDDALCFWTFSFCPQVCPGSPCAPTGTQTCEAFSNCLANACFGPYWCNCATQTYPDAGLYLLELGQCMLAGCPSCQADAGSSGLCTACTANCMGTTCTDSLGTCSQN